jgi:hypothetical protein
MFKFELEVCFWVQRPLFRFFPVFINPLDKVLPSSCNHPCQRAAQMLMFNPNSLCYRSLSNQGTKLRVTPLPE